MFLLVTLPGLLMSSAEDDSNGNSDDDQSQFSGSRNIDEEDDLSVDRTPEHDDDDDEDDDDQNNRENSSPRSSHSSRSSRSSHSSRSTENKSNTSSPTHISSKVLTTTTKKNIRKVDRSDFAKAPDAWAASDTPIHSLKCVTSNKKSIYKLPMTAEQNEFADKIFKDYVSRDILGLSEKHADAAEKKRVIMERKAARKKAIKSFLSTPFVEVKSFYKKKKKEWKLYRAGFRKVTSRRQRNFFRFCAERQVANVRKYIKSGHPVDDLDSDGRTGMHHAAAEVSFGLCFFFF